jgi:proline dehydrogenase
VVVQAYGRRAGAVIDWLHALALRLDRRIMVRLVKGAYWDAEVKRAQVLGLAELSRCSPASRPPMSATSPMRASCWG